MLLPKSQLILSHHVAHDGGHAKSNLVRCRLLYLTGSLKPQNERNIYHYLASASIIQLSRSFYAGVTKKNNR